MSIAERIASIIEKSKAKVPLTEEELGYYYRSQRPSNSWDPLEEIKEHEKIAKVNMTIKKLEELKTA